MWLGSSPNQECFTMNTMNIFPINQSFSILTTKFFLSNVLPYTLCRQLTRINIHKTTHINFTVVPKSHTCITQSIYLFHDRERGAGMSCLLHLILLEDYQSHLLKVILKWKNFKLRNEEFFREENVMIFV